MMMMVMVMVMTMTASVCVCAPFHRDEYPIHRWLALNETERANQLEASAASLSCLPAKVVVSRMGDGTRNEFNICTADSCDLIVLPAKQIWLFQRKGV